MTQLLEMKDKLIRFYGRFETYIIIVVKFCIAFCMFLTINANIGYMTKISSAPVALILALVCSVLPINATILIGGLFVILNMYALAMEAALVSLLLLLILYLLYFRFSPKDGISAVLTPVLFRYNVQYVMPMASGLLRSAQSVLAVVCGTILYFFVDGVRLNASILTSTNGEESDTLSKLNIIIGQLKGNKEMILVILIFVVTSLVVYFVRSMPIEHSWTIAILAGGIIQIIGLLVGFTLIGIQGKTLGIIVGGVVSVLLCFVIQFFMMNLDYARTERVQFEDDDYYYYVVAIPKKMIASKEKKVQRFGNTMTMGKRVKPVNTPDKEAEKNRKAIAEELDIDEDLLK